MKDMGTNAALIEFIDTWLDEHAWRLDERTLDFVLDARLLAAGEHYEEAPAATEWVASLAAV